MDPRWLNILSKITQIDDSIFWVKLLKLLSTFAQFFYYSNLLNVLSKDLRSTLKKWINLLIDLSNFTQSFDSLWVH